MTKARISRILGVTGGMLLDLAAMGYVAGLVVREPAYPPTSHLQIPSSQIANYEGQNVEVKGIPASVDYKPGFAGSGLEIVLHTENGGILNAESRIFPASLKEVRNARRVSYDTIQEVYEKLDRIVMSGNAIPITLMGRYSSDGNILKLHNIIIGNKAYNLFMPSR